MSGFLWLWLAVAVTVFWSVGAYNRLMRLRARALDAFGTVERQMQLHADAVRAHLAPYLTAQDPAVQEPLDLARLGPLWQQLWVELEMQASAMRVARANVLSVRTMHALVLRHQTLMSAWFSVSRSPEGMVEPSCPAELQAQWDDINRKVDIARAGLNEIVDEYNQAACQFPASLLVAVLGLGAAGPF